MVGSVYWNTGFGQEAGDVVKDAGGSKWGSKGKQGGSKGKQGGSKGTFFLLPLLFCDIMVKNN